MFVQQLQRGENRSSGLKSVLSVYYAILKVPNVVLKISYNKFTCIQGQKSPITIT